MPQAPAAVGPRDFRDLILPTQTANCTNGTRHNLRELKRLHGAFTGSSGLWFRGSTWPHKNFPAVPTPTEFMHQPIPSRLGDKPSPGPQPYFATTRKPQPPHWPGQWLDYAVVFCVMSKQTDGTGMFFFQIALLAPGHARVLRLMLFLGWCLGDFSDLPHAGEFSNGLISSWLFKTPRGMLILCYV